MSKIIKSVNSTAAVKSVNSTAAVKSGEPFLSSKNIGMIIGGILFIGMGIVAIFIVKALFNNNLAKGAGEALGELGKLMAAIANLGNMCTDNALACLFTGIGAFLVLTIAPFFKSSPAVEAISVETGKTENEVSKEIIDKSNEVIEKITKDGKLNESQIKLIETTVIEKILQEKLKEVQEKIGTEDRVNASIQDGITQSREREEKAKKESDIDKEEMKEVDDKIEEHIKDIK